MKELGKGRRGKEIGLKYDDRLFCVSCSAWMPVLFLLLVIDHGDGAHLRLAARQLSLNIYLSVHASR